MEKLTNPRKFEQIHHCAIVEYCSPLTGGKTVTGVFHKPTWIFAYHDGEKWHHLEITKSQICNLVWDALTLCEEYCKLKYQNNDNQE